MWRRLFVLGALALSVVVVPARATVDEAPVSVKLTGTVPVAQRGRALRATFEMRSSRTVEISNVTIEGDGWNGRPVASRAQRFALTSAAGSRLEVEATPARPDSRLVLRYDVDGVTYRDVFDFSPAADERRRHGRPVRLLSTPPNVVRTDSPNASPRVEPRGFAFDAAAGGPGAFGAAVPRLEEPALAGAAALAPERPAAGRLVQVTGTFVYKRDERLHTADPFIWPGADGLTVEIWERDYGGSGHDLKLISSTTDAFGHFDVTFFWDGVIEAQPDIMVFFIASNVKFLIVPEGDVVPYYWAAGPYDNFSGSHLDMGGLTTPNEADWGALNIFTDLMRDWRWAYTRHGVDLPPLLLMFPMGHKDVSHYHPDLQAIHFTPESQWRERTHAHEYAHHLNHERFVYVGPSYCNFQCTDIVPNCPHYNWCPENPTTAWGEGLPDYFSTIEVLTYAADYGIAAIDGNLYESLSRCTQCGASVFANAFDDESHATAMLLDIADTEQDTDMNGLPNGTDALALGEGAVWNTLTQLGPFTLEMFIIAFRSLYPQWSEQLWQTEANNQINYDITPPGQAGNFHSSSHTAGVASADATPTFSWTRATDDFSGVIGYSVRVAADDGMPDATAEIGNVTTWTSPALTPGRYRVSLRAVDRAGNWSASYTSWGDLVIRVAGPSNLTNYYYSGWDHPVVPRATNDATYFNVTAPATMLPGNAASTYWNSAAKNIGEGSTEINWLMRAYVDGVADESVPFTATPPGIVALAYNKGPITVRGGRHTFSAHVDDDEEISEANEADNEWGHQWIWTPYVLTSGSAVTRQAPPDRTGGWDDLPSTAGAWFNCDGFRVTNGSGSNWRVLWMRMDDPAADYDCRLHFITPAADTGFGSYRAYSRRPAGCLDAVVYNNIMTPTVSLWDVGVVNTSGSDATYYAKLVSASSVSSPDTITISYPAGEMLRLREFEVATADTGWYTVKVTLLSGNGPVYLAWYDRTIGTTALIDASALDTASTTSDPARLDVHLMTAGVYGLAVYRDQKDGTAAISVQLELVRTPPDYEPMQIARWYAPLVPRPAADGTPTVVAEPDTLYGDVASTYLNFMMWNASQSGQASSVYNHLCVDGVSKWGVTLTAPAPQYATAYNGATARTMTGGRHTLSLRIDPYDAREELLETNNGWGEQFVWGPALLSSAATLTRAAPPEMTGGWDEITHSPSGIWYDCDGLRVQAWLPVGGHSAYWGAYAVMPGDTSDVDVRLHEAADGTSTGFRSNLVRSTWGPGQSDYCLVNFGLTAFRDLDVGLLRVGDGVQPYTAQVVKSIFRATNPNAVFGPYSMIANALVGMHEFWLDAGAWDVNLGNSSGTVDWGLSVHDGARTYHNKSTTLDPGLAFMAGAGLGEHLRLTISTAGYYGVVVWKATSADLAKAGTYTLEVKPANVDAPGEPLARTALSAAWPNPFQRGATVVFELARESDVALDVYDLHGARVRTLAAGHWPSGRHEVRWDAGVAPGIYFLRFAADGVVATRRVVKVE